VRAWGCILSGRVPFLSIEITRRCPLSCPGCYAYAENHVGAAGSLKHLREFEGPQLVEEVLSLVDRHRPLHLSIVGGEPLVRRQEITRLLPELNHRGIHTQIVTSACSPIPLEWRQSRLLDIVVSIDGLPSEHDKRRAPATYERILNNIRGHAVIVHCTVTRQMTERVGYFREFLQFWNGRTEVRKIWISQYTPQIGESSTEILHRDARERLIAELSTLRDEFRRLELPVSLLQAYRRPPPDPGHCVFALTTKALSADLRTAVTPCQLGGSPDCSQCGCIAAAAMEAVRMHRLPIGIRTGLIYGASRVLGRQLKALRDRKFGLVPLQRAHAMRSEMQHADVNPTSRVGRETKTQAG
jgi:organic radical activating enzyme